MQIRMTPEDQQAVAQLGCEPQMTALLRALRDTPSYPWRECWVVVTAGMALLHFRRWDDLRGEYRRIAVGLRTLQDKFITATVLAATVLRWADGYRPAKRLANYGALAQPGMFVHHDTAVPA